MTENRSISRKDFLKVVGALTIGAGDAFILNKGSQMLERGATDIFLDSARKYLHKMEMKPDWLRADFPEKNVNFELPEDTIKESKKIYYEWQRQGLVKDDLFSSRSPVFVGLNDISIITAKSALRIYADIFSGSLDDIVGRFMETYKHEIHVLAYTLREELLGLETTNCKPFSFLHEVMFDLNEIQNTNPGCGLIERVQDMTGGFTMENFDKSVNSVWDLVKKHNDKSGEPMSISNFLSILYSINHGDIRKSFWDASVLTKLATRNSLINFQSNESFADGNFGMAHPMIDDIKASSRFITSTLQDPYALCLSANWVMQNVGFDRHVFNIPGSKDNNGFYWKPLDVDTAIGNIYHGINLTAATLVMDYRLIPAFILAEYLDFYNMHGVEKFVADIVVAMRGEQIVDAIDY